MLTIKKILLPLDLQEAALPLAVLHQAVTLASHFQSEILLLHVVRPPAYMDASDAGRELFERAIGNEQETLKMLLGPEPDRFVVRRMVLQGDPAREILRAAGDRHCDLIMMPTHGYNAWGRFLLGSVTAKVLHHSECPVWTGAHLDSSAETFTIRNVLCAVDFSPHSPRTIRWARDLASEFGAALTLAHVTPGVEIYGPGGSYELPQMKQELVSSAAKQMTTIQQELGTNAAAFIGSGDVPKVIHQAAADTKADVVVVGCRAVNGRLGTAGYGIIREARIPVVSV